MTTHTPEQDIIKTLRQQMNACSAELTDARDARQVERDNLRAEGIPLTELDDWTSAAQARFDVAGAKLEQAILALEAAQAVVVA